MFPPICSPYWFLFIAFFFILLLSSSYRLKGRNGGECNRVDGVGFDVLNKWKNPCVERNGRGTNRADFNDSFHEGSHGRASCRGAFSVMVVKFFVAHVPQWIDFFEIKVGKVKNAKDGDEQNHVVHFE